MYITKQIRKTTMKEESVQYYLRSNNREDGNESQENYDNDDDVREYPQKRQENYKNLGQYENHEKYILYLKKIFDINKGDYIKSIFELEKIKLQSKNINQNQKVSLEKEKIKINGQIQIRKREIQKEQKIQLILTQAKMQTIKSLIDAQQDLKQKEMLIYKFFGNRILLNQDKKTQRKRVTEKEREMIIEIYSQTKNFRQVCQKLGNKYHQNTIRNIVKKNK